MLYIDLLDSVKTAHPEKYSPEWWRSDSVDEQKRAIGIAHTTMMIRLLYGETIILPNNQANDSVAWLKAVQAFTSINKLEWPSVSITAFNSLQTTPNSEYLLEVTLKNFKDPNFIFSAWVGLDSKQKEKVVTNLEKDTPFKFAEMLDGVKSDFGSELNDQLQEQAEGLQRFYDYLVNWEKKGVVRKPYPSEYTIGSRMEKLKGQEAYVKELQQIASKIVKDHGVGGKEARSLWFKYLASLDEPVRTAAKSFVDRYYNEKISLSVNRGNALLSFIDHDEKTPLIEDELRDHIADQNNSQDGVIGKVALQAYPERIHGISSLDWKTCTKILIDDDFNRSLRKLQRLYREFDEFDRKAPDYFQQYRRWRSEMRDKLSEHNVVLAEALAPAVVQDSMGMRIFANVVPHTITGIAAGLTAGIGYAQGLSPELIMTSTGVATALSEFLVEKAKDNLIPEMIESSAAGRLRASLDDAISIRRDEDIL